MQQGKGSVSKLYWFPIGARGDFGEVLVMGKLTSPRSSRGAGPRHGPCRKERATVAGFSLST